MRPMNCLAVVLPMLLVPAIGQAQSNPSVKQITSALSRPAADAAPQAPTASTSSLKITPQMLLAPTRGIQLVPPDGTTAAAPPVRVETASASSGSTSSGGVSSGSTDACAADSGKCALFVQFANGSANSHARGGDGA